LNTLYAPSTFTASTTMRSPVYLLLLQAALS
jgi:hypothetical protein